MRGLTQEEAGKALYRSRSTVGKKELGTRGICVTELVEMAKLYEVDIGYFFK